MVSYVQTGTLRGEEETPLALSIKPQITSFVESCLKNTAEPGIYLLGIQGGVIYPDDFRQVLLTENSFINYGYLDGVDQLKRERLEEQLGEFVERNILQCMNFETFAARGLVVTEKKAPKVGVRITTDEVLVSLEYKLDIEQGEDRIRLESFSSTIPLRLGKLVEEAEALVEQHGALLEIPSFPGTYVTVFPFDRETVIYSLSDEGQRQPQIVAEAPLIFMFAVKKETDAPPQLAHIPNQVLRDGFPFEYQLSASDPDDDVLIFSSDSLLFPVGADGLMQVTPAEVGAHIVTFSVKDNEGLEDSQQVRIVVT